MNSRDQIIDRIRKLRRMTEANGASESEALMALAQVAKLLAQYNIDESELRLKADAIGMVDDSYSMPGQASSFHHLVAKAVAAFTHTKLRWRTVEEDVFGLGVPTTWIYVKFYGYPLDVESAITLCAICQTSIVTESEAWEKTNPLQKGKKKTDIELRESQRNSFFLGMCERLGERIRSFGATSTGTGLIVLKNQLVDEHYAEFLRNKGLTLGYSFQEPIRLDSAAYAAGKLAAENVDLGRRERLSA